MVRIARWAYTPADDCYTPCLPFNPEAIKRILQEECRGKLPKFPLCLVRRPGLRKTREKGQEVGRT